MNSENHPKTKLNDQGLVLIVDDEQRYLDSSAQLVSTWGYSVLTATTGAEAAGLLVANPIDVILLDLHMPVADGHKVIEYIIKKGLKTRVIAISGDPTLDDTIKALNRGVDTFLRKPISPDTLKKALAKSFKIKVLKSRKKQPAKSQEQHRIHRALFENAPNPMFFLDAKGVLRMVNGHFCELTGFSKREITGLHWSQWIEAEDREAMRHLFENRRSSSDQYPEVTVRLRTNMKGADGQQHASYKKILAAVNLSRIYSHRGKEEVLFGYYGVAQDITQKTKLDELKKFAEFHDPLTGFPNHVLFEDYLSNAIQQAKESDGSFSLLFVGLDDLKGINERYGHAVGDECISNIAAELTDSIRKDDIISRIDGSEFVLLLPDLYKQESLCQFAKKILAKVSTPFTVDDQQIVVPASFGLAVYPRNGETSDELMQQMRMTQGSFLLEEDCAGQSGSNWIKLVK